MEGNTLITTSYMSYAINGVLIHMLYLHILPRSMVWSKERTKSYYTYLNGYAHQTWETTSMMTIALIASPGTGLTTSTKLSEQSTHTCLPALKFSSKELLFSLDVNTPPTGTSSSLTPVTAEHVATQMAYVAQQRLDGYAEIVATQSSKNQSSTNRSLHTYQVK